MADGPKKRGQRDFVLRDSAAFLTLAAVAAIGLLLFFFAMPETGGVIIR